MQIPRHFANIGKSGQNFEQMSCLEQLNTYFKLNVPLNQTSHQKIWSKHKEFYVKNSLIHCILLMSIGPKSEQELSSQKSEFYDKNSIFWEFFPGIQNFEYFKVFTLFVIILLISCLLFGLAYFFSLRTIKDSEKLSQYECGFEPFDEATRHPFDVHFYVVGILFLILDVEIALLFPWVLGLRTTGWSSFLSMSLFLLILTIGFFYEWHRGALVWPHEQTRIIFEKTLNKFPQTNELKIKKKWIEKKKKKWK